MEKYINTTMRLFSDFLSGIEKALFCDDLWLYSEFENHVILIPRKVHRYERFKWGICDWENTDETEGVLSVEFVIKYCKNLFYCEYAGKKGHVSNSSLKDYPIEERVPKNQHLSLDSKIPYITGTYLEICKFLIYDKSIWWKK